MTAVRPATQTVAFVDAYAAAYRDLFHDVRSFDHFTRLHLGLISDVARKSLPAIGRIAGADPQALHHFIANAEWDVTQLRQRRLQLTRDALRSRSFVLCIDETGDQKYGTVTDYVSRQYIGNLGAVETGLVSVNAYGILDTITFPLLFQVFKPDRRLKPDDTYQTKPTIASHLVRTLVQQGFAIELVLADALYGESGPFLQTLHELGLSYIVAIRENHGVWLPPGQRVRTTRWRCWERVFSDGSTETRYIREVVYGVRRDIRFYQRTSDPKKLPAATTRFVMTNLSGDLRTELGNLYGLRTWIEIVFPQVTKANVRTGLGRGDDIPNLHVTVGNDDAINQQLDELPALRKRCLVQPDPQPFTDGLNRWRDLADMQYLTAIIYHLAVLCFEGLALLDQFSLPPLKFRQFNDPSEVGCE
ncbi:MAG: IS701 family transposase [Chloroflexota bacterium]|nr:IS701 family transposase [Chloroflexota bacterium]